MKNAIDEWILALPDGRKGPCPCGCGKTRRGISKKPEPHFEQFKKQMEKTENENID